MVAAGSPAIVLIQASTTTGGKSKRAWDDAAPSLDDARGDWPAKVATPVSTSISYKPPALLAAKTRPLASEKMAPYVPAGFRSLLMTEIVATFESEFKSIEMNSAFWPDFRIE